MLSSELQQLIQHHTTFEFWPAEPVSVTIWGGREYHINMVRQRARLTLHTPFSEVCKEVEGWMESGKSEDVGHFKSIYPVKIDMVNPFWVYTNKYIITFECEYAPEDIKPEPTFFPKELFEI